MGTAYRRCQLQPAAWSSMSVDPLRRTSGPAKRLLARELRRSATPAERHAWQLLRKRQILGLKFRRQHVVDGFIVDFYCPQLRLVIELDGAAHRSAIQSAYDTARSDWLVARGRHVVRLQNRDLTKKRLTELVRSVKEAVSESPLSTFVERGTGGEA